MKRNKGGYGSRNKQRNILPQDTSNPVIKMFQEYRTELDEKHDRYEALVKQSRDITIESKRIIFLLHNSNTNLDDEYKESVINEAETRLNRLVETNFKTISSILKGHDIYLYHRAYTAGVQEFLEALLFCQYLKNEFFETFNLISQRFADGDEDHSEEMLFPHTDYILGLGDTSGELMRRCINNLAVGNVDDCFKICNFVKCLYTGFLGLSHSGCKEISRKVYTLKQSLFKMELVCYNIKIRGSEIPKHMLVNVIENANEVGNDDDEGYF